LLRIEPRLDILRVQDAGLSGKADPLILEWAARERRILLTHDVNSVTRFAIERIDAGESMPGVLVVRPGTAFGEVISDILLFVLAGEPAELENRVRYIPL
jgi:hypothetical protein